MNNLRISFQRLRLFLSLLGYTQQLALAHARRTLRAAWLLLRSRRGSPWTLLCFSARILHPCSWSVAGQFYLQTRSGPLEYRRSLNAGRSKEPCYLGTEKARRLQRPLAAWYLQTEFDLHPSSAELTVLSHYRELTCMGSELMRAAGVGPKPFMSAEERYRCGVVFPGFIVLTCSQLVSGGLLKRRRGMPNLYPPQLNSERARIQYEELHLRAAQARRTLEVHTIQRSFADYLSAIECITQGSDCSNAAYSALLQQIEDIYSPVLYKEDTSEYLE